MQRAAPAKKRIWSTIAPISSSLTACSGLPALTASSSANSSPRASSASAILSSACARSPGTVVDHFPKAARAAATARSTSGSVESGARAISSPVAGLSTASVAPSPGALHAPSTKFS